MEFAQCRNDDYYNADFLDGNDRTFIRGYDWLTEMVVDNFFNNLELLDSDLMEKVLSEKVPESLQGEYEQVATFKLNDEMLDIEIRKVETYGDYIRFKLLEYIESERDQLITSMIEGMDEDIFNAIRNRVLKDNEQKPESERKEYFDTRKYRWTGKKVCDAPVEEE